MQLGYLQGAQGLQIRNNKRKTGTCITEYESPLWGQQILIEMEKRNH
jgi:hypothetical protein